MNNNSLRHNTIILTLGTILNKGLQFLVIPFFSRWLSTEEYGQFDLLYTYVSLLIPIISLATQEAMFRFCVEEVELNNRKKYITNSFIINLINYVFIICILILFRRLLGTNIYIAFCIYLFSELFSVYLRGYLRAERKLEIYAVSMMISTIFMAICVTIFVYFIKLGLFGILMGYAIGGLIGNVVICIMSKWHSMLNVKAIKLSSMKTLVAYSAPLIPNDIAWWIMSASDRQIININFGNAANGIYAITHKVPALCSVVFNMFSVSWQQEVVERINDKDRNLYINNVLNSLLDWVMTICAGLLAGSFLLYYYIFDNKYFDAIKYSPILIFAAAVLTVSQFLGGIQIALKRPKQNGITTVTGAISNIILHLLLWRYIGLYAAAISTLLANSIIVILRIILLYKEFRVKLKKKTIWVLGGFIYFFIMAYLHKSQLLNWVNLIMACIFFLTVNKEFVLKIMEKISFVRKDKL